MSKCMRDREQPRKCACGEAPAIKVKRLRDNAKLPTRATAGSAGWDLYAAEHAVVRHGQSTLVRTGIALEMPRGWEAQVRPRSGLASRLVVIPNSPGTIDSDYRGEVGVLLTYLADGWVNEEIYIGNEAFEVCEPFDHARAIEAGERIAQLVFQRVPEVSLVEVDELSETGRGRGGFGSTGR